MPVTPADEVKRKRLLVESVCQAGYTVAGHNVRRHEEELAPSLGIRAADD